MLPAMRGQDTGLRVQRVSEPGACAGDARDELASRRAHTSSECASESRRKSTRPAAGSSFDRYMELALYAPGPGLLQRRCAQARAGRGFHHGAGALAIVRRLRGSAMRRDPGCAGRGSILEIGAGSGRLAADVLSRLDVLGYAPERYFVLEISADLRERQRRHIAGVVPHLANRVEWLDAPPHAAFDGVVLANEVLDALPVTRFRWHPPGGEQGCEEMGVAREGMRFKWAPRSASGTLAAECARLAEAGGGWEKGYTSEYCERLVAWTAAVTESHRAGLVLWIDYGLPRRQYYFPERRDGTLICHFRRRAIADPFVAPGLEDITAWVDFTRLAQASAACGYALAGYTTQAHFLAGLSIDAEMHQLAGEIPTASHGLRTKHARSCCPGKWVSGSRPWPGCAAWMRRCRHSACRTCATRCKRSASFQPAAGSGPNCSRTAVIVASRRRCSCSAILAPGAASSSALGLTAAAAARAAIRYSRCG